MGILTTVGEQGTIDAIVSFLAPYIAWGTGTQTEIKTRTALVTESAETRVLATETDNGDNFDMVATITSASSQTITEMGVFDAISSGNMWIYHTHTGVALAIGDKIEYTVNFEQT